MKGCNLNSPLRKQIGETFRRKERIGKREDLQRLFKKGSRYHSKQYTLIIGKNDLDFSRLAVSIKKRVGSAVNRNYERRLCRECFRREKGKILTGFDVLIIVKETTHNFHESYAVLKGLFCRVFH